MTEQKRKALRILVVEDEPAISELCRIVLKADGFEVDTALNGRDAQPMIERDDDYDLCLVDIRTPGMNGPELYQWMRETHSQLANKVIFATGDTMGGDTEGFLERAGRPFLPKPFTPGELRAVVRETLGR
jgi:DNA-binding response OmpR family regulator